MTPTDVHDRLGVLGLVAVVRAAEPTTALRTATTLVDAGVGAVEVTCTVPDAPAVVRELADHDVLLGAGSVTTEEQLDAMVASGARFAVSPVAPPFLVPAATAAGVLAVPGCATPGEVWAAVQAGAQAVKVFPAARLGGPAYLRDLAGPLPGLSLLVSGGIGVDEVAAYRDAGAWCVGLGSPLAGRMTDDERRAAAAAAITASRRRDDRPAAP